MKAYKPLLVSSLTLLLSACIFTTKDHNTALEKRFVIKETVGNKTVMFTQSDIHPDWNCKKLGEQSMPIYETKLKGVTGIGGQYGGQINKAKDYIKEHKLNNTTLVRMFMPNEHAVLGIEYTDLDKAKNTFYACKNTPAAYNPMSFEKQK